MDIEVDRLAEVQREDSHDGLGIDYITSGYKIKINIRELNKFIDEGLYFIDRIQ
jgi:hypothetical protein